MKTIIENLKNISSEYNILFNENNVGKVEKFEIEDIKLDENLVYWFSYCDPLNFNIPWIVESLELYGFDNLIDSQYGYRQIGTDKKNMSWDKNWLVIGDASGDPIIFDFETKKIFAAIHGIGYWKPILLAENMKDFLVLLYCWLISLKKYDYEVFNQDYMIKENLKEEFKKNILEHNISVDKFNNMFKLV